MQARINITFVTVLLALIVVHVATADESNLKQIMQALRDDSVAIFDGLLTDDFSKVAQGADRIANHPQIPPAQIQLVAAELGPEMATFKQFDTTVHDLAVSIGAAAEEKDHDRAATNYQSMLDGCFGCHAAYRQRVAAVLGGATAQE